MNSSMVCLSSLSVPRGGTTVLRSPCGLLNSFAGQQQAVAGGLTSALRRTSIRDEDEGVVCRL